MEHKCELCKHNFELDSDIYNECPICSKVLYPKMSDSGMSIHSCNKPDYHYRIKQLESQLTAAAERERTSNEAIADWHKVADLRSDEIVRLKERERVLRESLTEMVQAFVDYEMEVDIEPHHEHIKMMRKARAALAQMKGEA